MIIHDPLEIQIQYKKVDIFLLIKPYLRYLLTQLRLSWDYLPFVHYGVC